jgi:hypothetical protein
MKNETFVITAVAKWLLKLLSVVPWNEVGSYLDCLGIKGEMQWLT